MKTQERCPVCGEMCPLQPAGVPHIAFLSCDWCKSYKLLDCELIEQDSKFLEDLDQEEPPC